METTFLFPPCIVFGRGAVGRLGERTAGLGVRALVVTGRSAMRRSGALDRLLDLLATVEVGAELFEQVEHDPSLNTVRKGIEAAREAECDVVIGMGGGSPVDAAKAVAALADTPGSVEDYFSGQHEIETPGLPFIAVPTTSGTGAEMTKNSVLTDTDAGVKKSLRSPHMVASVAIVDPELTLSCPPGLTAASGMDALTQAIECYITRAANPISDVLSQSAARRLFRNLGGAVREGDNIEYREAMALGSMQCGMAFANASLGAVHGLAHPIGAGFGAPHGLVCAVLLAPVLEFNYPACSERMDRLARHMGLASGRDMPKAIRDLADKVGIPRSLAEYGMDESHLPGILARCRSGSMSNNPREASDEDLAGILRQVI